MSFRAATIMIATFVFGIVPGTLLVVWALLLGVAGAAAGLAGLIGLGNPWVVLAGPLLITAAVGAVYGYVALFHAAGDFVDVTVVRWLAGGIAANLFGFGFVIVTGMAERSSASEWFVLTSPLVVGVAHVARYLASPR